MLDLAFTAFLVLCAATLALYATYLYVERIRKGDRGPRSFFQWIKNLLEAIWGL